MLTSGIVTGKLIGFTYLAAVIGIQRKNRYSIRRSPTECNLTQMFPINFEQ